MKHFRTSFLALLIAIIADHACGQIHIDLFNEGTFTTPEFSKLGIVATADTGVRLDGGIGVVGGNTDSLIEVGETLVVHLPFRVETLIMQTRPGFIANFNMEFEAFSNGISLGTIPFNFSQNVDFDFVKVFGPQIDAYTLTGIGGPFPADNVTNISFLPPPLVNQSFEDGVPGQTGAPGWEALDDVFTFAGNAKTGNNSIRLPVPAGEDSASSQLVQEFDGITQGMYVQASAFALNSSIDPIADGNFGLVTIDFLDENGEVIDINPSDEATGVSSEPIDEDSALDEFVFLNSGYVVVPAESCKARITLSHNLSSEPNSSRSGSVFFDDAALNIVSSSVARTFVSASEEFEIVDSQTLAGAPPLVYEIVHDGVGQIRMDTIGSDVNTEISLYDNFGRFVDSAEGVANGAPGEQQAQLFFQSLPAGRYLLVVGERPFSSGEFFFSPDVSSESSGNFVVTLSSNDLAPPVSPQTVGTFNPTGFGFFESLVLELELNTPTYYEIDYDGISPISFCASDAAGNPGPVASLGLYDLFGNLLDAGLNRLSFDSLEESTYFLGIANETIDFFPNFQSESTTSFSQPISLEISTGILGDINCDGVINLLDVVPFVEILSTGTSNAKADINQDSVVDLLDVDPFVQLLLAP